MGRFVARLLAATIVGFGILTCQASLASASPVAPVAASSPAGTAKQGPQDQSVGDAIVPGFDSQTYGPNDDGSYPCTGLNAGTPSDCTPTAIPLPFPVTFYGSAYSSVYLNNNGNLTFGTPLSQYTPESLNQIDVPMIAPFWADVDTRTGPTVTFGYGTVDGYAAFGVNWLDVGCYSENNAVADSFQVLLISRPDLGSGDWQIEYNYGPLTWDSGQASGGDAQCLGGSPARAGYTSGAGPSCELPGSGVSGGLLDTDPVTGLEYNDYGSSTLGRYIFTVGGATGTPKGCGSYFAIGDSYSSGEGTDNYNYSGGPPCDRGSSAWPALLSAEYAAVPLLSPDTFVACSGATTAEQAPQVAALQNWTDSNGPPGLVTLTAGGDDLAFSTVLRNCVLGSALAGGALCLGTLGYEVHVLNSDSFLDRMKNFYESVAEAAGGASNVVVVGYPNLFPEPSLANDLSATAYCPWLGLNSPEVLTAFALAQEDLNDVLASAAYAAGVRYVWLGDLFEGHELCTGDAWINTLRPGYSGAGHPDITGQQAIASFVADQLGYLEGDGTAGEGGDARHTAPNGTAKTKNSGAKKPGPAASTNAPRPQYSASGAAAPSATSSPSTTASITLSSGLPGATVGAPYIGYLWGSGGTAPYTWSVSSGALPAGLSLDPDTGIISGTPTTAGTASFTVTATDSGSPAQTASEAVSITVTATTALSVTTTSLPTPTVGQEYSATLTATGGVPVYAWSVSSGTLPAGLSLDPDTGIISGTPTAAGSSTFTVQASDSASPTANTATQTLTLSVAASTAPLTLTPSALPSATAGGTYSVPLPSTGGTAPLAWSVSSGSLPPGLSIDPAAGVISGIPTQPGTFSFGVSVSDADSHTATENLSITVTAGAAPSITTTSLPGATAGSAYSQQLYGTGGVPDYTWSVTSGSLPDGLSLDPSSGIISGTPTTAGSYSFTVTLADSTTPTAATATQSYTVAVAAPPPAPAFSVSDTVTSGTVGDAYEASLIPANGTSPYTYTVTSGALPTGLSLDPNFGIISGTPTTAGTYTATITVTDSSSPTPQTVTDSVSITIAAPGTLAVSTTSLTDGAVGTPYATPVAATGGIGADAFAVTSGSLPDGLTLDPTTGIINGTPTTAGTSTFTVTVTDSATPTADTATASLALTIGAATPVSIATTSLPDAQQGIAYSQLLAATGGAPPYTWSVSSGSLPDGLTLNPSTGVISGTPTGSGASTFTVEATDSLTPTAQTTTQSLTLTVDAAAQLAITTTALPEATQATAYSTTLDAGGGTTPYTWSVSSGSLPAGLTLDPDSGELYGTPTGSGSFTFTVEVTDSSTPTPQTASQELTLTVSPAALPPQAISFTPPASGTYGGTATLSATGGGSGNPVVFTVDSSSGSGVCAVSGTNGTTVKYTGVGSCVIDANQAGNGSYSAAPQVQGTIPVGKASQAISFTPPASGAYGGTATLSATGGGSGNPVVFSVDASSGHGVCAVSGTNGATVKYTGVGDCVIDANQAGNVDYLAAAQVRRTVTIGKAASRVTLTITGSPVAYGNEKAVIFKATVTATGGTPTGAVTVAGNGKTLCTATLSRGAVTCSPGSTTLLAPGSYHVTASYGGSTTYDTATSSATTLTVDKETTKTKLATNASSVSYGKEKTLVVTVTVTPQYPGTTVAGTVTITASRVTLCKGKALTRGKATCSPAARTTLPKGTYSLIATYSGNADYAASKSSAKSVKVDSGIGASPAFTPAPLFTSCSPFVELACRVAGELQHQQVDGLARAL
jgi:hypothetical protein